MGNYNIYYISKFFKRACNYFLFYISTFFNVCVYVCIYFICFFLSIVKKISWVFNISVNLNHNTKIPVHKKNSTREKIPTSKGVLK